MFVRLICQRRALLRHREMLQCVRAHATGPVSSCACHVKPRVLVLPHTGQHDRGRNYAPSGFVLEPFWPSGGQNSLSSATIFLKPSGCSFSRERVAKYLA